MTMTVIGIDPILLAYFAGLIDGEGYIGSKRRLPTTKNHMTAPKYSVAFSISMTDPEPVFKLAGFCGKAETVRHIERGKNKPIFDFQLEHDSAATLIRAVLPYLLCKRLQAEKALALDALRQQSKRHRTKVVRTMTWQTGRACGSEYRLMGLSDEFIAQCEVIHQSLLRGAPRSGNGSRFRS